MPDEPTETSNSESASIPASPQEPIPDVSISPSTSEQVDVPQVAPENPREADSAVAVNNPSNAEAMADKDISQSVPVEPILDNGNKGGNGINVEDQTAQTQPIEPLNKPNVTIEKTSDGVTITEVMQPTAHSERNEPLAKPNISSAVGNTAKQERVRKKLEKIVEFLNTNGKVTNDEVEKLLHVSDATATRYLEQLEKEGKIKQVGKTGQNVSYSPLR